MIDEHLSDWITFENNFESWKIEDLEDDRALVTRVLSPSKISIVRITGRSLFLQLNLDMQKFYSVSTNQIPITGSILKTGNNNSLICTVMVNGLWYRGRARFCRIHQQLVHVRYLDVDGSGIYHKNKVLLLHKNFSQLPANKLEFSLSNITPNENAVWSFNTCERLKQLVEHQIVRITATFKREDSFSFGGTMKVNKSDVGQILYREDFVRLANFEKRILSIEMLSYDDDEEGYVSESSLNK